MPVIPAIDSIRVLNDRWLKMYEHAARRLRPNVTKILLISAELQAPTGRGVFVTCNGEVWWVPYEYARMEVVDE